MLRRPALYALLAALVLAVSVGWVRPGFSAAAPVRVMPLGDSITAGPGCWRALLWDRLQRTGYTNIDFVGTQPGGGCSVPHDGDHEGHGGFSATGIADQNQLPPWLAATSPDVVLMHLGTNDMWGGFIPTATVLAAYTKLVGQMRAANPNMKIMVAQIIPMNPPGCPTCAGDVVALNNAIPGWAAGLTTAQSPIVVVDQWTGFSTATDTGDGVHPGDSGFQKMADRWYPALARVLDGVLPPSSPPPASPTPSSSPPSSSPPSSSPPSSSPPPSGSGGCAATYRVTSQWDGGFQADVAVTNNSAAASSGWTVSFAFANGQRITQSWNATVAQSGAAVTARNAAWNGGLAAGGSASFGFLGSWIGGNATPAVACALG